VVVTGPGSPSGRWTPQDDGLLADVGVATAVHRVGGPEPAESDGTRARAERWLRTSSPWQRWWVDGSVELAARVAPDADVVYAWMSPFESAEAAMRLAQRLGKPWVADLGDPWALDEMLVYPTRFHRSAERNLMRRLLATASAIVMSTPEAVERLRAAFPELCDRPVVHVPNGFDERDFAVAAEARPDAQFRIVHTGYLHTELGRRQRRRKLLGRVLGGAVPGVDILARSHVYLLDAVDRLVEDDPSLAGRIEIHLAGVLSSADLELQGRSGAVRIHGYLRHSDTIALLRTADLLFLPMHDLPPGRRAGIVPGKTYEYLASGRPILAAVPDGDARDLLERAGNAFLCRPRDTEGLRAAIAEQLRRVEAGERPARTRREVVDRYAYSGLAGELAGVFDGVLASAAAADRPGPAVVAVP
jgi:glycosyltransferase involved in cell wall biosynthesis